MVFSSYEVKLEKHCISKILQVFAFEILLSLFIYYKQARQTL